LLLTALVVILIGLLVIGIVAAVYYFIRDRER
jgi:capsule polysaccharide export protein KpsE/RkpR